jgi:hypothetical protein
MAKRQGYGVKRTKCRCGRLTANRGKVCIRCLNTPRVDRGTELPPRPADCDRGRVVRKQYLAGRDIMENY